MERKPGDVNFFTREILETRLLPSNSLLGKLRNEYFLDPGWFWALLAWNAKECKGMARNERTIARSGKDGQEIERQPGALSVFTREIVKLDFSAPPDLGHF